jgi:H+/Cl- antiporter ClcA
MLVSASAVIGCWLNAPIGGVLFIFEITSNEDIWDKQTFTYAFICSITSTLTTQIL